MLPCRLRYVAVSWPWCVASLYMPFLDSLALGCPTPTGHLARWHLVVQLYDLALGCPTLRSGTWLPNSTPFSTLRHVTSSAQLCPTRVLVNLLYILFDLAGRASYRLWYYLTSTIYPIRWLHVIHYRHFLLRVHDLANCVYTSSTLSIIFHAHQHDVFLPRPLLLFGCEFTGTPVDSDLCLSHSMYISTLRYLAVPDVMSWRYSIIWSRSSQCLMILSGSIHLHVEPLVICWLYGFHVMIRSTLCCCCASSLFQNCYTHAYAQPLSGVPSWNVITMSCSSTCYYHGLWFLFSVTYCYYDDKLLYRRSVGAAFLISMDIVLLIRCWLYWTMI